MIGVPHEKWGESLKAFIVTGGAVLDAEAVAAFCEPLIARMKIPQDVETIDVIPRNAGGKVLKTELRARAAS